MSRIIEKSVCVRTQAAVRIGLGIWVVKVKTYRVGFVIVWKGAFPGQAMLSFIIPGEANAPFFFFGIKSNRFVFRMCFFGGLVESSTAFFGLF